MPVEDDQAAGADHGHARLAGHFRFRPIADMNNFGYRRLIKGTLYRRIDIPAVEVRDGVGDTYRLPDGLKVMLVRGTAGTRMTQQAALLREMLATPSHEAIRFGLDRVARTVQVEPAD